MQAGSVVTQDNAMVGLAVEQGPAWNYGDHDGGPGGVGVVVGGVGPGVVVEWANTGVVCSYCVNALKHDLVVRCIPSKR